MAEFLPAVEKVLLLEGGLVDDPSDRGGITHYGISLRFLSGVNSQATADDIRALTKEKAIEFYRQYFWEPSGIAQIDNQVLADKLFDMMVVMGRGNTIRLLQSVLGIDKDGMLGPMTASAANEAQPAVLLKFMQLEGVRYFLEIARTQFSQRRFLVGWLTRCLA